MTVGELKDQIRRLQRPTFSSKMHEYKHKKPDKNEKELHKFRKSKGELSDNMTERPHCDRDQKFWHKQVEHLAKSFSVYPG